MILENYTTIRLYSRTNLDMDYFFLFEPKTDVQRREIKMIMTEAEREWWEDDKGFVLPGYVCYRLKEFGINCIGFLTNETHTKGNEYTLVYNCI